MAENARDRQLRLAVLALLLTILGLLAFVGYGPSIRGRLSLDGVPRTGTGSADVDGVSFGIGGSAAATISPGVAAPIDLQLTNPHGVSMSVAWLEVRVRKVTAPNASGHRPCSTADFHVVQAPAGLDLSVPARSTRTLSSMDVGRSTWPRVGMVDRSVNQDGCKGSSLVLAYTGTGRLTG